MIIKFYFHDPSSYNHLSPIYENIKGSYDCELVNLKNNNKTYISDIGIYGLSTNQIEIFSKNKDKKKILYIENQVGKRLDNIFSLNFDLVLVCNEKCRDFLIHKYKNLNVKVIGDTHYNNLIKNYNSKKCLDKKFITIFLSPDDKNMDIELLNINNFFYLIDSIKKINSENNLILIRFHPRTTEELKLKIKKKYPNLYFNNIISNDEVLKRSKITLGFGTSMYYESLINEVPSCFVNLNNKFTTLYDFFDLNEILLIDNEEDLKEFITFPKLDNNFIDSHKMAINNFINQIFKLT